MIIPAPIDDEEEAVVAVVAVVAHMNRWLVSASLSATRRASTVSLGRTLRERSCTRAKPARTISTEMLPYRITKDDGRQGLMRERRVR